MENKTQGGKISGIARQLIAMADMTRTSIVSTLSEQTSFLDQYASEKTLQRSDFTLTDLKRRPTTIYVCLKGSSLAGPLSKIMYILIDLAITAMEEVPGRPPYNVLFAMDEFYCLGRNETLDRAMGLMAGFGVTLWPLLQHIGQLKRYYPDTFDNFIRNCRAVQFFGDLDPDTLQYIEKRVGDRVLSRHSGGLDRRPLLTMYELSSSYFLRDSRRQLLLFQQEPAALLQLIDYYGNFPQQWYEDDPRAQDRSQYAAWEQHA
jgi:type IV secretion system protein VirD4